MVGEKDNLNIMVTDPYQEEYEKFTPDLMKILIRNQILGSCFKFCILKKWGCHNVEEQEKTWEMLLSIQYKDLDDVKAYVAAKAIGNAGDQDYEDDTNTVIIGDISFFNYFSTFYIHKEK